MSPLLCATIPLNEKRLSAIITLMTEKYVQLAAPNCGGLWPPHAAYYAVELEHYLYAICCHCFREAPGGRMVMLRTSTPLSIGELARLHTQLTPELFCIPWLLRTTSELPRLNAVVAMPTVAQQ